MKDVHIVVGSAVIALSAATGLWGAWRWWRVEPSRLFWRLLRTSQAVLVIEAILGGILELSHKAPSIHLLYGLLPLAVSFVGEQLRISSAEMILASSGFESAAEVGELPEEDQQAMVLSILRRELGVMTITALVIVVLALRAAMTAH
jgi:hypothetical protein